MRGLFTPIKSILLYTVLIVSAVYLSACTAIYRDTVKAPTKQEIVELKTMQPRSVLKKGTFHMQRVSDRSSVLVDPAIKLKRPELPPFDVVYISQPVEDILIELANTAGESIVIPSSVREQTITVVHSGSNFKGMLDIVLSKVGYHYNYVEGVWYITRFPVRNYQLEISQSDRGGSLNTALEPKQIISDAATVEASGGIEELSTSYTDELWEQVSDTLEQLVLVGTGSSALADSGSDETFGGVSAASGSVVGSNTEQSRLIPEAGFSGGSGDTTRPEDLLAVQGSDHLSSGDDAQPFLQITPSAGIITVRTSPEAHRMIETYLEQVQQSLLRQIFVEARIVAIVTDKETNRGSNLSGSSLDLGIPGLKSLGGALGFSGQPAVPTGVNEQLGGFLNLTFNNNNIQSVVQMLNQVGDVYTISSPSLLARNNQISRVAITQQIGYAETTVETNTNSDGNVVIGQRTDEAQFRNAGTVLSIIPFIGKNKVQMRMRLSISNQSGAVSIFTAVGVGDPVRNDVPELSTNLIDQDMIMDYGRVHAIGGVIQSSTNLDSSYVPGFNHVPGLREIFSTANNKKTNTEFMVLMRVSRS